MNRDEYLKAMKSKNKKMMSDNKGIMEPDDLQMHVDISGEPVKTKNVEEDPSPKKKSNSFKKTRKMLGM